MEFNAHQVDHVINFDFPLNPADYIHRAGRVGRVNSNGVEGTWSVYMPKYGFTVEG